jgi:hypothetical protein
MATSLLRVMRVAEGAAKIPTPSAKHFKSTILSSVRKGDDAFTARFANLLANGISLDGKTGTLRLGKSSFRGLISRCYSNGGDLTLLFNSLGINVKDPATATVIKRFKALARSSPEGKMASVKNSTRIIKRDIRRQGILADDTFLSATPSLNVRAPGSAAGRNAAVLAKSRVTYDKMLLSSKQPALTAYFFKGLQKVAARHGTKLGYSAVAGTAVYHLFAWMDTYIDDHSGPFQVTTQSQHDEHSPLVEERIRYPYTCGLSNMSGVISHPLHVKIRSLFQAQDDDDFRSNLCRDASLYDICGGWCGPKLVVHNIDVEDYLPFNVKLVCKQLTYGDAIGAIARASGETVASILKEGFVGFTSSFSRIWEYLGSFVIAAGIAAVAYFATNHFYQKYNIKRRDKDGALQEATHKLPMVPIIFAILIFLLVFYFAFSLIRIKIPGTLIPAVNPVWIDDGSGAADDSDDDDDDADDGGSGGGGGGVSDVNGII